MLESSGTSGLSCLFIVTGSCGCFSRSLLSEQTECRWYFLRFDGNKGIVLPLNGGVTLSPAVVF